MGTWNLAATARTDFCDMMASLDETQVSQDSLCEGWDAKSVLAHLVMFVELGPFSFFTTMARAGFNGDKAWRQAAAARRTRPTADLISTLRANAGHSAPMPGFPEALTVTDVAVHTQDVRRPLGLDGGLDAEVLRTSLEFLTTHKQATMLVDVPDLSGLRFEATDLGWSHGDGALVSGTGEAILMSLARRPSVYGELSGDGVARFTA